MDSPVANSRWRTTEYVVQVQYEHKPHIMEILSKEFPVQVENHFLNTVTLRVQLQIASDHAAVVLRKKFAVVELGNRKTFF